MSHQKLVAIHDVLNVEAISLQKLAQPANLIFPHFGIINGGPDIAITQL